MDGVDVDNIQEKSIEVSSFESFLVSIAIQFS